MIFLYDKSPNVSGAFLKFDLLSSPIRLTAWYAWNSASSWLGSWQDYLIFVRSKPEMLQFLATTTQRCTGDSSNKWITFLCCCIICNRKNTAKHDVLPLLRFSNIDQQTKTKKGDAETKKKQSKKPYLGFEHWPSCQYVIIPTPQPLWFLTYWRYWLKSMDS